MHNNNESYDSRSHIDEVRRELDSKIDAKTSNHVFYWAIGAVGSLLGAIIFYFSTQINDINIKASQLENRITALETKLNYKPYHI